MQPGQSPGHSTDVTGQYCVTHFQCDGVDFETARVASTSSKFTCRACCLNCVSIACSVKEHAGLGITRSE